MPDLVVTNRGFSSVSVRRNQCIATPCPADPNGTGEEGGIIDPLDFINAFSQG